MHSRLYIAHTYRLFRPSLYLHRNLPPFGRQFVSGSCFSTMSDDPRKGETPEEKRARMKAENAGMTDDQKKAAREARKKEEAGA